MSDTEIRIEAIREVNGDGKQGYRITKIQALSGKDLPSVYRKNERPVAILGTGWSNPENRLFLFNGEKPVCIQGWDYIWPRFYTIADMEKINAHIKDAGQHLADVNAHLRKERESWNDTVTFVDGEEVISKGTARPWEPWLSSSKKPSDEQLYKITDSSWSLCCTEAELEHDPGLKFTKSKYRIISQGCDLPAHQGPARTLKRNDTILQNIETGQFVFTCARFLCQI